MFRLSRIARVAILAVVAGAVVFGPAAAGLVSHQAVAIGPPWSSHFWNGNNEHN
jgi:hypothetical protein